MKTPIVLALLLALGSWAHAQAPSPTPKPKGTRNDRIYPPAAAAEKAIGFDGAGFLINGQRRYLSSGTVHYPRVPHELWRDRLLRMKRADFVTVETYCFWNLHEPRENAWDFTGDADLERFLKTSQDLGLTSIVRVGPYVCAEWESGGWPLWLRFKPPTNLRTAEPEFLKWNDHWYDKILPLVAKHQIHKGGNVVLVQLENEHPLGWGVVEGDPYFTRLRDQALKHGIEVPWFFSGLNHGPNPSPSDIDPAQRKNPWFSTEFWAGWFDTYGLVADKKLRAVEKANWSVMAHGGGGHNFYMLHGGSNFDLWSDNSTGSSYDFGGAIGQAGDLRPAYYKMKRANLLAQSFPEVLANSKSALAEFKNAAKGNKIEVHGARRSPAGTLIFLRNNDSEESLATLGDGGSLRLPRYTTVALPRDLEIARDIRIASSTLPILCTADNGATTTAVFYGQPGETGTITLASPDKKPVSVTVPTDTISETNLELAGRHVRLLVIPQDLSLRTWRVGEPGHQFLVFGPAFVQDVQMKGGQPFVTYERYLGQPSCGQIAVYGSKEWHLAAPADPALEKATAPVLGEWKMLPAGAPALAAFDDKDWFTSEQPRQMGADGDNSSHAWYRATFTAPKAGQGTVRLRAKDKAAVFVNGKQAMGTGNDFKADIVAGKNTIAVFVSHAGRNKGYNYLKPAAELDPKGLLDQVTVTVDSLQLPVTGWKMRGGPAPDSAIWTNPAGTSGWKPLAASDGTPAFFHTTFQSTTSKDTGLHPILRLKWTGLTRGMVWVNGHSLGRYPEKIRVDSLYVPEPWLRDGSNDVVVFDEAGASPAGVRLVVDPASREVAVAGQPVSPSTPFVVPQEFPVRDLVAMNAGNLAFRAAASASSEENLATPAPRATDGNPDTAWKAAGKIESGVPGPWLAVDLGKPAAADIVEILWESASREYKYTIDGSADGQTWNKLGDQSSAVPTSPDSPSELSRLNFKGEPVRHLRVTIDAGRTLAIAEFRVFTNQK